MLSLILASIALLVLGGGIAQNIMQISIEGFSVPRALVFDTSQLPYQFMYMTSQALLALAPFGGDADFGICWAAHDGRLVI